MSRKNPPAGGDEIEYETEQDSGVFEKKLKKIKDKFKSCEKERAEYLAGWQRAKADLINYKKDQEQRIADYYKFANEGLILELLPVLDSLDLAIQESKKLNKKLATADDAKQAKPQKNFSDFAVPSQSLIEGIKQVKVQFMEVLRKHGVEEIKAVGEKFNPEFHEAVSEADPERSRRIGEGIIIEEIQKGYKLNGKVIKPSKVKISK